MVARLLTTPASDIAEGRHGLRVLSTRGRRTGREHRTPVGVLRLHDERFLVCPDRRRDWPRNLLADATCALRSGARSCRCTAREITGDSAIEVVAAYLAAVEVPWALRAFRLGRSPDRTPIRSALPRFAIFRLDDAEPERVTR